MDCFQYTDCFHCASTYQIVLMQSKSTPIWAWAWNWWLVAPYGTTHHSEFKTSGSQVPTSVMNRAKPRVGMISSATLVGVSNAIPYAFSSVLSMVVRQI